MGLTSIGLVAKPFPVSCDYKLGSLRRRADRVFQVRPVSAHSVDTPGT
jgi:hypothetical protein